MSDKKYQVLVNEMTMESISLQKTMGVSDRDMGEVLLGTAMAFLHKSALSDEVLNQVLEGLKRK